jgi:DNA replication protein DnaC
MSGPRDPSERAPCPFGACDGSGFVVDEDTRVATPCQCRPQVVARARASALRARIPQRYRNVSFDRPPVPQISEPVVRVVRRFVADIDRNIEEGRGLWFQGPSGTGKTTLAMLVSRAAMEAGRSVALYSMPRLLGELRATYREGSAMEDVELLERLAHVDVLHIDDLGAERRNDWVLEQLYVIINSRYEEQRSVVITTNVTDPGQLAEQVTPRIVSRLEEMCELLPLYSADARKPVFDVPAA